MYAIHIFSGKLQGALLNGMTNRNVAIKKAYANTIGHLIRVNFMLFLKTFCFWSVLVANVHIL